MQKLHALLKYQQKSQGLLFCSLCIALLWTLNTFIVMFTINCCS